VNRSVYIHEIMIMLRKERKLDRLKMNPRGANKKVPICAVPMHAPQTSSLWRGVGEVSSAIEVGCGRRVQPRQFVSACQGVFGSFWESTGFWSLLFSFLGIAQRLSIGRGQDIDSTTKLPGLIT